MADTYKIVAGDTLWKIAQDVLGSGARWRELLAANPDAVSRAGDPRTLRKGFELVIPGTGPSSGDAAGGGAGGGSGGGATVDPASGVTDVEPVSVGSAVIPQGARVVIVNNPLGSDASKLYHLVYEWNGVELSYEVGDRARFDELFGTVDNFAQVNTVSQASFDNQGFTGVGSVDQILGSTESLGSQIEREVRALGLEDLPAWLSGDTDALAFVAQATAQEWSSGRLWTALEGTAGFQARFGDVIGDYRQGGRSIATAVDQIVADEDRYRATLRTFSMQSGVELTNEYIHSIMAQGWTPTSAAAVLDAGQVVINNPGALDQANELLGSIGISGQLSDVGLINALQGAGPPEIVEAFNTVFAATALADAGLDDLDLDLIAELVDTSDRLLTADSFSELAQELSFQFIRFGAELDRKELGISEDDVVAAAFGRESPSGKSAGEVINLLGRFERDRRNAAQGFDQSSAFLDNEGRLRVQGLSGL